MQRSFTRVLGLCHRCAGVVLVALFLSLMLTPEAEAQFAGGRSAPLVTQPINDGNLVVLPGNTRPEAVVTANDRGVVAEDLPLQHMQLQLRRPAAQEQALVALIDQLHDRNSPNYHHWLTAAEIGDRFGPAASDIQAVTGWLTQHGFAVNTVYTNGMVIDFSGSAGQIRAAFHTEIHNLQVANVAHIANTSDPQVPAALAPVIVGVVSLNDFKPTPVFVHPDVRADAKPPTETDGVTHYVSPGDIATIYNFKPMFASNLNGHGQTIYVIGNSDMYQRSDWTTFRQAFGIPNTSYNVNLEFVGPEPPSGSGNCFYPGTNNGSNSEATLDVEYASAAAPGAEIVLAACADTGGVTSGILIAVQNLVNAASPPAIISISYEHCEATAGASMNAAINTAYQTGVAEGTSIYAAAGDQGASGCTFQGLTGNAGIGVNAFASTPYNVAVGGTDFEDDYLGEDSSYWNVNNAADWSSAKSYIPEIPWNSSCGSQLIAQYHGYDFSYGSAGFCNSSFVTANPLYAESFAGGGGPSGCATGAPSVSYVVSGTCAGYAKPSWQSLLGVPNDGVRDVPDVSLFSSGGPQAVGPWHQTYVWCYSDTSRGGKACTVSPGGWTFGGFGTSFATPIWAGIQAMINQQTGERWGNPNVRLYQIAAAEYGNASQLFSCASNESGPYKGSCIFNDVTFGDTDVPCVEDGTILYNCYNPSGTNGVMSTVDTSYVPTYKAQAGWDFATGIGTVNVANLVAIWSPKTGTHDFSGDGKSDILWRNTSGGLAVWLMNGGTVSQSAGLGTLPSSYSIIGQHDFNEDGKTDVLWRDTSGNVSMWLMNGAAVSSAAAVGNLTSNWALYGTGDLNGDGYGDLLWRDSNTGTVAVWFMNGATVAATAVFGALPSSWTILGDGYGDILWRDSAGDIALWGVQNGQVTSSSGLGTVTSNFVVQGIGDFNGDGKIDILWRDTNSGALSIWFTDGTQVTSAGIVSTLPSNWSVAQIGDYDGDGRSDILLLDSAGDVAIWFMNGAAVSSSAGVSNVGPTWQVQNVNAN